MATKRKTSTRRKAAGKTHDKSSVSIARVDELSAPMLSVTTDSSADFVAATQQAVMQILQASSDEKTKRAALAVLGKAAQSDVSICNNTFTNNPSGQS